MTRPAPALHTVLVRYKSVTNKMHFTLQKKVSRTYVYSNCSGVTQIYHMALPAHALRAV
jgi:hypothetical protein